MFPHVTTDTFELVSLLMGLCFASSLTTPLSIKPFNLDRESRFASDDLLRARDSDSGSLFETSSSQRIIDQVPAVLVHLSISDRQLSSGAGGFELADVAKAGKLVRDTGWWRKG
jgi:hypothetical protein